MVFLDGFLRHQNFRADRMNVVGKLRDAVKNKFDYYYLDLNEFTFTTIIR